MLGQLLVVASLSPSFSHFPDTVTRMISQVSKVRTPAHHVRFPIVYLPDGHCFPLQLRVLPHPLALLIALPHFLPPRHPTFPLHTPTTAAKLSRSALLGPGALTSRHALPSAAFIALCPVCNPGVHPQPTAPNGPLPQSVFQLAIVSSPPKCSHLCHHSHGAAGFEL